VWRVSEREPWRKGWTRTCRALRAISAIQLVGQRIDQRGRQSEEKDGSERSREGSGGPDYSPALVVGGRGRPSADDAASILAARGLGIPYG
jgi:hypothetical protein